MTAPIVVTVPLEALERAPEMPVCRHCWQYAEFFSIYRRSLGERYGHFCSTHTEPGDDELNWAAHARALNRAIEWGRELRAMKEGKL